VARLSEEIVERRLQQLRALGREYAKAKAECIKIEEGKKSVLAVLMKRYAAKGFESAAAQEREARADPEYRETIEALATAVEIAEAARWQLEVAKLGVDMYRTLEASRRAELSGYS
jgi:hypothetical protein